MKTSNKIFLGLLAVIALNVLTGMVILRSNLSPKGMGNGDIVVKGNGTLKTQKLAVADFSKLFIDGHYEVVLSQGTEFLEITSDENLVDHFTTEKTKDGILIIKAKEEYSLQPKGAVKIKLGFKTLSEIEISGKTAISSVGTLSFENLQLNIRNVSKANLSINVKENLNIWMKDIAEANLKGQTFKSKIELSDIAKLYAKDLVLQTVHIQTRDMSFADLNVTQKIDAQAADKSTIEYIGQPKGQLNDRDMSRIRKK